jgi:hypothetical protein
MAYQTSSALSSQHTVSILNLNVIKPSALRCASRICTGRGYTHTPKSTSTKEASDNRQRGEFLTPNINMNLYLPLFFSHSFLCQLLLVRLPKKQMNRLWSQRLLWTAMEMRAQKPSDMNYILMSCGDAAQIHSRSYLTQERSMRYLVLHQQCLGFVVALFGYIEGIQAMPLDVGG